MLCLFVIFFNLILSEGGSINNEPKSVLLYSEYLKYQKQCVWKPLHSTLSTCGVAEQCIIDNVPFADDGLGYWLLHRVGPFETTGAFQAVVCGGYFPKGTQGSFSIGSIGGAVDPVTGALLEFPPIHLHHASFSSDTAKQYYLAANITAHLPFLDLTKRKTVSLAYPSSGASDLQCLSEDGGISCMLMKVPKGYGVQITAEKNGFRQYSLHTQDVRIKDSPPLLHYILFGEMLLYPNTSAVVAMKKVHSVTLEINGEKPPFTYKLELNTSMFQFITNYFPIKTQFVSSRVHWHPIEGDEAWVLRGTQQDLGIEKWLQRPVIHKLDDSLVWDAISVPGGNMKHFKSLLERNLNFNISKQEALSKVKNPRIPLFVPFSDDLLPNLLSRRHPVMLCKFFGKEETIDDASINASVSAMRQNYAAAGSADRLRRARSLFASPTKPVSNFSSQAQLKNAYVGVLPGKYYRAAFNYAELTTHNKYQNHCGQFEIEAGEFLTFVTFSAPRLKQPTDYNSLPLVTQQHSLFLSRVHFPGLDL